MGERSMFFNSTANVRRRWQASDMADYWKSFLSAGLIHENGQPQLEVVADGSNREVGIKVGRALIEGHLYIRDALGKFKIDDPDPVLDRIDRLVLRYDNRPGEDESKYIKAFIVKGITSDNPHPPALTRNYIDDTPITYELSLAQIHVRAGKSFIEQSDIVDERFIESVCGISSSLVSVPTDHLMKIWHEWFDNLQLESYITEREFAYVQGKMKMELANLNLKLSASEKIKSGVTFGTDGNESFGGIEIDYTKTTLSEDYISGGTELSVTSEVELMVGQELTIYDSQNLERFRILDINENTLTIEPLANNYDTQTNVARSMMVYDEVAKAIKFGSFGTLDIVLVDGAPLPQTLSSGSNLVSIQEKIFYFDSNRYLRVRDKFGVWTLKERVHGEYLNKLTTDGVKYVYVFSSNRMWDDETGQETGNREMFLTIYDINGNRVFHKRLGSSGYWSVPDTKFYNGELYFANQYFSNSANIQKTTFDGTNIGPITQLASGTWTGNQLLIMNESEFVYYRFNSGRVDYQRIKTSSSPHVFNQAGLVSGGIIGGKLTFVSVEGNIVKLHQTTNDKDWETKTYTLGMSASKASAIIDEDETIHLAILVGTSLYIAKKLSTEPDFDGLVRYGTATGNTINIPVAHNQRYRKPLLALDGNKLMAELLIGDGEAVNVNDLRFITPPTKNIACFSDSTSDIVLTSGSVNGYDMTIENISGQQQAIGRIPDTQIGDVRLTYRRDQTDKDSFIRKIVGGRD